MQFVYVPGGEFIRGFTNENQEAAEKISKVVNANYSEMRPVKLERVSSFLITRTPILNFIKNPEIEASYVPLYSDYQEAESIAKRMKMRLPSETEWEYCVRAGSDTLFPFGDELLEENELEKWMTQDFYDLQKSKSNELGIYGLFTGEWTCDVFQTDFRAQTDGLTSKVIRGGAELIFGRGKIRNGYGACLLCECHLAIWLIISVHLGLFSIYKIFNKEYSLSEFSPQYLLIGTIYDEALVIDENSVLYSTIYWVV